MIQPIPIRRCEKIMLSIVVWLLFVSFLAGCAVKQSSDSDGHSVTLESAAPESTQHGDDLETELTVSLPKQEFLVDEPLTATIKWSVTRGWLIAVDSYPFFDYKIELYNSRGKPVPYTEAGERLAGQVGGGRRITFRLDQDISIYEESLYLSEWYDFGETGTYTLSVTTRNVIISSTPHSGVENQAQFTSQPVTFTIR